MIRRIPFLLLGILAMVSPLRLAAQSADSRAGLETIAAGVAGGRRLRYWSGGRTDRARIRSFEFGSQRVTLR